MPDSTSEDDTDSLVRAVARAPDATPLDIERDARLGTRIKDKYTIDRVLGEGGMAIVYEATHRNRKRFAIKMLRRRLAWSSDAQSRFVREGYVANTVSHPGAVAILDDDTAEDGSTFIVMELLDGAPLDRICDASTSGVPTRLAIEIGVQLLDVLAAAHEKGIVHRDIKPQNLFLTRDGSVKVLDFGIARLRDSASHVDTTESGTMMGTPAFMAPEQALGRTDEIDAQTDLWAAGATLFTALSGHFVHSGDNGLELAARAATQPARSLASVAPKVPPAIVAIVDRALCFERSKRWPNASAMRNALIAAHSALFGEPASRKSLAALFLTDSAWTTGHAMADTEDAPQPAKRINTRWILGATGCAIVLLSVAFAVSARRAPKEKETTPLTSAPVSIAVSTTSTPVAIASFPDIPIAAAPKPQPQPHRVTVPSASAKRSCDPPYTIEDGKRIPKAECL